MCTLTEVDLASRASMRLRAIAEDVATAARTWTPIRGSSLPTAKTARESDPRVAATALLLEVACADERFTLRERALVERTLRDEYGLDAPHAERLVRTAQNARGQAAGEWVFTNTLMGAFNRLQREGFARLLDRVANADGAPGGREVYVTRKLRSLLRLEPDHV